MSNKIPFTEPIGGKNQGNQNLNWAIDQNGNAFFAGDVRISGDLIADDITIDDLTMDSLTITGNATIGGTLSVTGAASLLTSLECPVIYGGTAATSGVLIKPTTGAATMGLVTIGTGSNGATLSLQSSTIGVVIGNSAAALSVLGSAASRVALMVCKDANIGTSDHGQIEIIGLTNTAKTLALGVDTTNNRGYIKATEVGIGGYPIRFNGIVDIAPSTGIDPVADNAIAIGTTSLRYTSVNSALFQATIAASGTTTVFGSNNTQAAAADVGSSLTFSGSSVQQSSAGSGWNGAATTDAYMKFSTRGSNSLTERMRILSTGQVQIGSATTIGALLSVSSGNVILSATTLGTTATSGFTWLPVCAGVPTGVPTGHNNTGAAPFVYNNSNGKLYVYSAGSWGLV